MSGKPFAIAVESEDQRQERERRTFSYTAYIPERRSGKNRRKKSWFGYDEYLHSYRTWLKFCNSPSCLNWQHPSAIMSFLPRTPSYTEALFLLRLQLITTEPILLPLIGLRLSSTMQSLMKTVHGIAFRFRRAVVWMKESTLCPGKRTPSCSRQRLLNYGMLPKHEDT